jgi:hypothetical protein
MAILGRILRFYYQVIGYYYQSTVVLQPGYYSTKGSKRGSEYLH